MTEDVPKLSARWIRTACPPMLGRRILENGLILNAAGFRVSAFTGGYPVLITFSTTPEDKPVIASAARAETERIARHFESIQGVVSSRRKFHECLITKNAEPLPGPETETRKHGGVSPRLLLAFFCLCLDRRAEIAVGIRICGNLDSGCRGEYAMAKIVSHAEPITS
jgi:hypothetical protein